KSDERDLIRLAIRAIDFDATSPGDAQLARNDGACVLLAHGTGPDTHGIGLRHSSYYARITFAAELVEHSVVVARVGGTVSGTIRAGHSEREIQDALASAVDQLVAVLNRALIAPRTAAINPCRDLDRARDARRPSPRLPTRRSTL